MNDRYKRVRDRSNYPLDSLERRLSIGSIAASAVVSSGPYTSIFFHEVVIAFSVDCSFHSRKGHKGSRKKKDSNKMHD